MPSGLDLFDSEACCSHDDDDDDDDDRSDEDDLSSSESMKQFIVDDSSSIFSSSSETTKKNTNRRILSDTEAEDYEYEAGDENPIMSHSEIQEQFTILRHQQESSKVKKSSTNDKKPLLFDIFTSSKTKEKVQNKQSHKANNSNSKLAASKADHLPGFCQYRLTEWSLTVSKLGSDILIFQHEY
jgi:hypothetical protein